MSTEGVIRKGAILGGGPYNIPNFQIDTYGVYTNNTPSGAFRSFGSLQSQFATESHLDICAERLGMDPFELRLKNAMRKGDQTHTKQPLNSSSMSDVLEAARTASRWESGVPSVRGATRSDLGGEGTRQSCTLVSRGVIAPDAAADPSNRRGAA
jgi:CO/xanthine dehydrogenase Mo-binding subunit